MDDKKFLDFKEYRKTHTLQETANHFGISVGYAINLNSSETMDDWRRKNRLRARMRYEKNRKKLVQDVIKNVSSSPFSQDEAPQPIMPLGGNKVEPQNGVVKTISTSTVEKGDGVEWDIMPMTLDQYHDAYNHYKKRVVELKKEIEIKDKSIDRRDQIIVELRKTLRSKKQGDILPAPTDNPTNIEIKVGDAIISVSTRGKDDFEQEA